VTSTTGQTVCPSELPLQWNGQSITQAGTYTANLQSASGCDSVATFEVTLLPPQECGTVRNLKSDIFVPKAWSPNGDGYNDRLRPLTVKIKEIRYFRIFNRFGQLVFETHTIGEGWDGIFGGKPQVMDVYTWTLEATGEDGRFYKRSGNSVLLR
jgi:gliding motility-associated-like protein